MLASDRHQGNMEQIWDEKSSWFFHRTEKSKEKFENRLVFRLIRDRVLLQENSHILDIGCGTGRHLLEFSKYSSHLTGTDISSKMLTYAKEKLEKVSKDRKSTRLNSSHANISYAVFCLKKKN